MIINNNLNAMNAHRQMGMNVNATGKAMEKLSSGLRINRAGDDAAGLAISEKMRAQVRGLDQASRNSQDGISLIQTAEGALNETHAILQRMRELVVQAGNGTNEEADLDAIQEEINALIEELGGADETGIADRTAFNGKKLLDGSLDINLQIGANTSQALQITIEDMSATGLLVDTVDVSGVGYDPDTHITAIDTAIESVSEQRSKLGAFQNRLEHTIKNLDNASENLQAAESRIRDVDMASEMMEFTRANILNQASQAMLAQANQQPQAVLQLLR
ncbi:flagellin N-terminal helical domain-containing protein [Sutcliffiella sp. NC1]|uniref:flagellin N-terminal helical domain-containing protein n=1 Tax=Sutcliffiella sp. NC1 TaxID=3004096 RepID=UPI0022DDAB6F|nr:flagellin [Sutcliffiella sp. NC1]WBL14499.1 flagellin [Sutcliffiella sp. NC1]